MISQIAPRSPTSVWRTLLGLCLLALFVGPPADGAPKRRKPAKAVTPAEKTPAEKTPDEKTPEERPPPADGKAPLDQTGPEYQEALKLFRKGIADFDGGYYREAIEKFEAAMKLYPSPKIHTRIALCYMWLGNFLKALDHYERFLKEFTPEPDNEADVRLKEEVETKEVPKLLKMIAQVKVVMEGPPGAEIRINGRPVGSAPMDQVIRLEAGPVAVSATHKGHHEFRRDLEMARGQTAEVVITLIKIKPKVIKTVITVPATPIYKRWWFWTVVGTVVVGGAAGLSAYLSLREIPRDLTGTPIPHDGLTLRW